MILHLLMMVVVWRIGCGLFFLFIRQIEQGIKIKSKEEIEHLTDLNRYKEKASTIDGTTHLR